jgi:hypothetical protein
VFGASWRRSFDEIAEHAEANVGECCLFARDRWSLPRHGFHWAQRWSVGKAETMASEQFKVGDKIRVIGYRPGKYPPGYVDDMGTEELFKSLVGRRYTIRGFDDFGHIELHPKRNHVVWIEADLVKLVSASR